MAQCRISGCGTELVDGVTWYHCYAVKGKPEVCIECDKYFKRERYRRIKKVKYVSKPEDRTLTDEEKLLTEISRLRDERNIEKLTQWLGAAILEHTIDYFIKREIRKAREQDKDVDIATVEHHARKKTEKWTYHNAKTTIPSHVLLAQIMVKHKIVHESLGDMGSTWHIAFNALGGRYKTEFPLDRDGLPIEPPGVSRLAIITYVRKKADTKIRPGRMGIISVSYKNPARDNITERRYILCKFDKDGKSESFDKVMEEMRRRHEGEKHSKRLLKEAALIPLYKSKTMLDRVVDAWTEERSSEGGE